jgi:hypothetical protein
MAALLLAENLACGLAGYSFLFRFVAFSHIVELFSLQCTFIVSSHVHSDVPRTLLQELDRSLEPGLLALMAPPVL